MSEYLNYYSLSTISLNLIDESESFLFLLTLFKFNPRFGQLSKSKLRDSTLESAADFEVEREGWKISGRFTNIKSGWISK